MGLEGSLVLIDFIEPDPILVVGVLNHVEPQASRLVVDRALGILKHPLDVLVLESFLDLDRRNDYVHGVS